MFRTVLTASLAGAAITIAAPAIAQKAPGGAPNAAAIGARANSQGPANASPNGMMHASPNSVLRTNPVTTTTTPVVPTVPPTTRAVNSQGLTHASPTGIAHANTNSVLARGSVPASTLPGLTNGLTVNNSAGTSVGTVSSVITGSDGTIRAVVITDAQGKTTTVPANSLSIAGGVVTTTSTSIGG
jgi:hypothetical protein